MIDTVRVVIIGVSVANINKKYFVLTNKEGKTEVKIAQNFLYRIFYFFQKFNFLPNAYARTPAHLIHWHD